MRKLNVGCGWECHDGWINVDNTSKPQRVNYPIIYMDATERWPCKDNHYDYILSEHMIEHLPEEKGLFMLQEAFRTLRVGGVIRISCPNRLFAEALIDNEVHDKHPFVENYARKIFKREPLKGDARRIGMRTLREQGHVWVPTPHQLIGQLKKAGFEDVRQVEYGKSVHEELNGIELVDGVREWESVSVEGIKK